MELPPELMALHQVCKSGTVGNRVHTIRSGVTSMRIANVRGGRDETSSHSFDPGGYFFYLLRSGRLLFYLLRSGRIVPESYSATFLHQAVGIGWG